MSDPVNVFCSYSHRDDAYREELENHLAPLRKLDEVRTWHDGRLVPGEDRGAVIFEQLQRADLILLLISADFLSSDFCYDVELSRAIERHRAGTACVIPIIVRPCDWKNTPFSNLQALPPQARPVTRWKNQDTAWTEVVSGIRAAVESWLSRKGSRIPPPQTLAALRESDAQVRPDPKIPPQFHSQARPTAERTAVPPAGGNEIAHVRSAYRLLHSYHRRLFNLLSRTRQAITNKFGPLPSATWGPYLFGWPDRKDPTTHFVQDLIPVAHSFFAWSSAERPVQGAFQITIYHMGDDAMDGDPRTVEPTAAMLAPVLASRSLLATYITTVTRTRRNADPGTGRMYPS